jgi:hypothetical protein
MFLPRYNLHKKVSFLSYFYLSLGARPAPPMGVAPEALVGFSEGDHRLNYILSLVFFRLIHCAR